MSIVKTIGVVVTNVCSLVGGWFAAAKLVPVAAAAVGVTAGAAIVAAKVVTFIGASWICGTVAARVLTYSGLMYTNEEIAMNIAGKMAEKFNVDASMFDFNKINSQQHADAAMHDAAVAAAAASV